MSTTTTDSKVKQTPHALLSRDPVQLSRELDLSLDDTFKIRAKVAARILFPQCIAPDTTNENTSLIPTFTTALDLCIQKSVLAESFRRIGPFPFISSGSKNLDVLLCPSSTALVDGPACTINPSIIASKTTKSHKKRRLETISEHSHREPDNLGLFPSLHDMYDMVSISNGLLPGHILEVSGPPSSGKTQLALTMAANAILCDKPWSVRYIAGSNGAVTSLARRLRQICHSLINKSGLSKAACDKSFNNISFYAVSDMFTLLSVLSTIENEIQQYPKDPNILIIVDSFSSIFLSSSSLDPGTDGGTSGALLSAAALSLRKLSRSGATPAISPEENIERSYHCASRQCTIIVTNGTVSGQIKVPLPTGDIVYSKPALGDSWKAADIRVAFEIDGDDYPEDASSNQVCIHRRIRVYLIKHWLKRCNTITSNILIGIQRSGIVDV